MIACKTIIAFGAPTKAGTAAAHGSPLGPEEIKGARERLGWEYPPLSCPTTPRLVARRRRARRRAAADWEARLDRLDAAKRDDFERRQRRELPAGVDDALAEACDEFRAKNAKLATRQASGAVLDAIVPAMPELSAARPTSPRRTTPRPRARRR